MLPPIMRYRCWGAGSYSIDPDLIQQVWEAENAVDCFTLAFLQNAAPCALACALGLISLEGRQLVRAQAPLCAASAHSAACCQESLSCLLHLQGLTARRCKRAQDAECGACMQFWTPMLVAAAARWTMN